jgi:hypothetical protein
MIKIALSRSALALSLVLAGAAVGCGANPGEESTDAATQELASDGNEAVTANDQGTIDMTDQANGKTVTVQFDGSNQAQVTTPKGVTFDKAMTCGG